MQAFQAEYVFFLDWFVKLELLEIRSGEKPQVRVGTSIVNRTLFPFIQQCENMSWTERVLPYVERL